MTSRLEFLQFHHTRIPVHHSSSYLAKFSIICFCSQEWERQREAKKKEQEAALAAEEDEAKPVEDAPKPVEDAPKPVDNRTQSEIESDEVEKLCNSVYKVEIRYSSSN